MEKNCAGCKKTLPLEDFYKNKTNLDGKSNYCKSCTKSNAKKYYRRKLVRKSKLLHNMPNSVNVETTNKLLEIKKMVDVLHVELEDLVLSTYNNKNNA